jgi:diguanylate cyclase (GGDEF)-like protein
MSQHALSHAAVAALLAQQRLDFQRRLPAQLAELEGLAVELTSGDGFRATVEDLHQRLHRLAGAGGTFGLEVLSARARALEQRVAGWLSGRLEGVDPVDLQAFAAEVTALRDVSTATSQAATPVAPVAREQAREAADRIWLVEDDAEVGELLKRQLESFNYEVCLFQRIADAELAARTGRPDILLHDVLFEEEGENATEVLPLHPRLAGLDCPLIFITSCDDFQSRVQASRLGAEGYFLKPLDVPRLVNRLAQLSDKSGGSPQRVLIVDDDEVLAEHYRLVLLGAGMTAEVLERPERIIEKLEAFRPELVLMDLYMPEYTGPELAGLIRQYEKWDGLPIVYLSAETDLDLQIQAVGRGADDFLTKPISDSHLIAAVRVRVDRARQLSAQISRDSLTGLLKHAAAREMIEMEMARSRRSDKPLTLAMLDIDHFKTVNDSYGHAVGDLVISSVAMLLRQRLRRSDIIGRYGGEEFVLALPECSADDAYLLLEDIRHRFSKVCFNHDRQKFSCTLSAGLAASTEIPGREGAELLVAADEALYVAKRSGRNRVHKARPTPPREARRRQA